MPRLAKILQGRLLRIVALYALGYAVLAWATEAPMLLRILNGVAISVSAGVCIAYAPVLCDSLLARTPTRGEQLGAGIFFVSTNVLGMRSLSVVARDLGWPGIYNTDMTTLVYASGILGGLLHLWAPEALDGRLPRARWAHTGGVVAIGLFIAFMTWSIHCTLGPPPTVVLQ